MAQRHSLRRSAAAEVDALFQLAVDSGQARPCSAAAAVPTSARCRRSTADRHLLLGRRPALGGVLVRSTRRAVARGHRAGCSISRRRQRRIVRSHRSDHRSCPFRRRFVVSGQARPIRSRVTRTRLPAQPHRLPRARIDGPMEHVPTPLAGNPAEPCGDPRRAVRRRTARWADLPVGV